MVRDLNHLYRATPALHAVDFDGAGFEWIEWNDSENSVFSWIRRDRDGGFVVCVTNMTPVVREAYRLGVPEAGTYDVLLNSDDEKYCGSGTGTKQVESDTREYNGRPHSIELTLPPLATLLLAKR